MNFVKKNAAWNDECVEATKTEYRRGWQEGQLLNAILLDRKHGCLRCGPRLGRVRLRVSQVSK